MNKDDLLKKTQKSAQNIFEKGKEIVQDLMDKAEESGLNEKVGQIKDNVVEKAKEVAQNVGESEVAQNTKDSLQGFIGKVAENLEGMRKNAQESNVVKEAEKSMGKFSKDFKNKVKETKKMTRQELKQDKGGAGKAVAGVAIGAAAVAAAYTLYMNRKNNEESVKAEFSERMKKWHELDDESLKEDLNSGIKRMTIRNVKVYPRMSNALLGEDIVLNIRPEGEEITFNPEEISEPINPMDDIKKKAQELAKMVQEKISKFTEDLGQKAEEIRDSADNVVSSAGENLQNAKIKTQAVTETVVSKGMEAAENAKIKAQEAFSNAKEKVSEVTGSAKDKVKDVVDQAAKAAEEFREKAQDDIEQVSDVKDELKYKVENVRSDVKEDLNRKFENLDPEYPGTNDNGMPNKDEEFFENRSESKEDLGEDNIVEKIEKPKFNPGARNPEVEDMMMKNVDSKIKWEEDKDVFTKAGEDIKIAATTGFEAFRKTLGKVKEQISSNIETAKKNAEETFKKEESEVKEEEGTSPKTFEVTIHNRGNKDYFFSPMLIQRFNTKNRSTLPVPRHGEGTTLEQRIIKPGETYTGKITIELSDSDDSLVVFEDMMMNNSVAVLLSDEINKEHTEREDEDMVDDILFSDYDDSFEDLNIDETNNNDDNMENSQRVEQEF